MHDHSDNRPSTPRWLVRLTSAAVFFVAFLYLTPALYAEVNMAQLTAALRARGWDRGLAYGDGNRLHATCNTDADCGGSNNPNICKTLTITYTGRNAASAPTYTTKRCEPSHCPSPFVGFMANGNPNRPVEELTDILVTRGAAHEVTIPVPSPAVNPWDPNQRRCVQMEAETSAPCRL